MAYLDKKRASNRAAIVIGVACIEALAIYAVVRGLDVPFFPRAADRPLTGEQIPLTPLPTPKPEPIPTAQPSPDFDRVIVRPIDLGPPMGPLILDPAPFPSPKAAPSPQPTPDIGIETPRFAPRAARPTGRPAGWATANDYPARDLREGNQGVTGFRLTIGVDGRVVNCTITSSSGHPGLDQATCENVARRARFEPATDGNGARTAGSYANSIRWVIPQ